MYEWYDDFFVILLYLTRFNKSKYILLIFWTRLYLLHNWSNQISKSLWKVNIFINKLTTPPVIFHLFILWFGTFQMCFRLTVSMEMFTNFVNISIKFVVHLYVEDVWKVLERKKKEKQCFRYRFYCNVNFMTTFKYCC